MLFDIIIYIVEKTIGITWSLSSYSLRKFNGTKTETEILTDKLNELSERINKLENSSTSPILQNYR